jgi:hypothetical protein
VQKFRHGKFGRKCRANTHYQYGPKPDINSWYSASSFFPKFLPQVAMKHKKILYGLAAVLTVVAASVFVKRHVEPNSEILYCSNELSHQVRRLSSGECDEDEIQNKVDPVLQLDELKSAEDRWRNSNNSEYRFTIVYYCWFCLPGRGPFQVTVKEKQVTSISPIEMPDPASNRETQRPCCEIEDGHSVEDLFQLIRRHIGEFGFSINYDKNTGFPLNFHSDGDISVIDDEFGFETSDFYPVQR